MTVLEGRTKVTFLAYQGTVKTFETVFTGEVDCGPMLVVHRTLEMVVAAAMVEHGNSSARAAKTERTYISINRRFLLWNNGSNSIDEDRTCKVFSTLISTVKASQAEAARPWRASGRKLPASHEDT